MAKKSKDSTTAKTEPEVKTEGSPVEEVNASKRVRKKDHIRLSLSKSL